MKRGYLCEHHYDHLACEYEEYDIAFRGVDKCGLCDKEATHCLGRPVSDMIFFPDIINADMEVIISGLKDMLYSGRLSDNHKRYLHYVIRAIRGGIR